MEPAYVHSGKVELYHPGKIERYHGNNRIYRVVQQDYTPEIISQGDALALGLILILWHESTLEFSVNKMYIAERMGLRNVLPRTEMCLSKFLV